MPHRTIAPTMTVEQSTEIAPFEQLLLSLLASAFVLHSYYKGAMTIVARNRLQ